MTRQPRPDINRRRIPASKAIDGLSKRPVAPITPGSGPSKRIMDLRRPTQPSAQPPPSLRSRPANVQTPVSKPLPQYRFPASQWRRWWQGSALVIGAIILGLTSQNLILGQWALGLYGVLVLILKINSRYTFMAALLSLVCVPVFLTINYEGLADNYAVYAYLLLVIGAVSAAIELRRDQRAQ